MSLLAVKGLTVRFGRIVAVQDVDLEVDSGTVLGIVGESGSGKSTLIRAVAGLLKPAAGRILLDGRELGRHRRGRSQVQIVFQDPTVALDPRMKVGAAIAEAVDGPRAARRHEVERHLERVGLDPDLARRLPAELSGGQRQRVCIARALAAKPRVLLADEVTSALDVSVQNEVLNVLRRVQRELGLTIVFVSHNIAVVRYLCDEIAVMQDARIVEQAPAEELVLSPSRAYTRALLGAVPALPV